MLLRRDGARKIGNAPSLKERTHRHDIVRTLTPQQRAYVRAFVFLTGGNAERAAALAGYASPAQMAEYLSGVPMVLAAIRAEQARFIGCELGTLAIATLKACMLDEKAKWSDRVNAARIAAEAARFIGRNVPAGDGNQHDKPLSEMTAQELDALISTTQRTLSDLSQEKHTVDSSVTPSNAEPIAAK